MVLELSALGGGKGVVEQAGNGERRDKERVGEEQGGERKGYRKNKAVPRNNLKKCHLSNSFFLYLLMDGICGVNLSYRQLF